MTWYKAGLRFGCTQCGKCCTGAPGYVWLSEEDIDTMIAHLKLSREQFLQKYTRRVGERIALLENRHNYDCVFLKDKRCVVYQARPKQCRKFPWWPEQLQSAQAWEEAGKHCEGINHPDAPLISAQEIEERLND